MSKLIPLTKGKFAVVDDDDFDAISQHKWMYEGGYAIRYVVTNKYYYINTEKTKRRKNRQKKILMHRVINNTQDGFDTDHVNGDKLDNRKCNLRDATHSQNQRNKISQRNNKSGYRGVHWCRTHERWVSRISNGSGKRIVLGYFTDKDLAYYHYCKKAVEIYGDFAHKDVLEFINKYESK